MSTVHDLSGPAGPAQSEPSSPWLGGGVPPGYGGGQEGPGGPGGRHGGRRSAAVVAAVAAAGLVVGAGATLAAHALSGHPLTTAQIAAKVDPGLVDITSTLGYQGGQSAGTGMVLTSSGEVLTNNHVVEGATAITAMDIGNGRAYRAVVVGYDRTRDIAVLRLQGASGLPTVTLGDSSQLRPGQPVVALGNAGGRGGTPSVATGRVAALGQAVRASDQASGATEQLTGLIRSNAGIQPGDSGGPLVNTAGQVIGVNTAASARFELGGSPAPTQAFTIPIDTARAIASQIEAGTSSATVHLGRTAFLGVGIVAVNTAPGPGAGVTGVVAGSPAAAAGLAPGDVITSAGGHRVTSPSRLQSVMDTYHPGDHITVRWADQYGQTHSASVTLASGPAG